MVFKPGAFDFRYFCTLKNIKHPMMLRIQRKIKLAISSSFGTSLSGVVELEKVMVLLVMFRNGLNWSVEFNCSRCSKSLINPCVLFWRSSMNGLKVEFHL